MRCRGFTLVEIVVALSLTLIVTGSIHKLLLTSQRLARMQAARLDLQSNLRAGALVIANELRELNAVDGGSPDQTDIRSVAATAITYRAARGVGFLCQPATGGSLRVARSSFSGVRDPEPSRDLAYLFSERDPAAAQPDEWIPLPIAGISTTGNCPGVAGPAIAITVAAPVSAPAGTPIRIYETMELRLYQAGGEWWLGARSVSAGEAIQPVIGPLAGSDGLLLQYQDRNGIPTNDPAAVRSVVVRLRAISDQLRVAPEGPPLEEELATQVTLRNARRFGP